MEVPELLTARLRLRAWRDSDVAELAEIYADPETVKYLPANDLEATRRQVERIKDHWQRHGYGLWAVEELATGRFIGRIGLMHHDDWIASPHDSEVGWVIARDLTGQGLATEGGSAALDFGAETIAMHRFISIIHVENAASQRVAEKLGMSREGETEWRGWPVAWFGLDR